MKLELVLKQMYIITEEMHRLMYGFELECELFEGKCLCYGKLYDSLEQIEFVEEDVLTSEGMRKVVNPKCSENWFEMDFRSPSVDTDVVLYVSRFIYENVRNFLKTNQDGDIQTLFLGCILNLYYSSGLFDRCGILDLNSVTNLLVDERTKKYALTMEELFFQNINQFFGMLCEKHMFTDEKVNRFLQTYLTDGNEEMLQNIVESINPRFSLASDFVREYIKEWERFSKYNNEEYTPEDLQEIYPEYQYANLLLSISSLQNFLSSKGEKNDFAKYMDALDEEIFDISVGIKKPSSLEISYQKGNIITTHPDSFSQFGFGLPYVEFISKYECYEDIKKYALDEFLVTYQIMKSNMGICYPFRIHDEKKIMIASSVKLAAQLALAKEKELKAKEDKHTVIRQFSHTYMNMRATSLYNIAMELLKNPDKQYRNYGRKLIYEYSVKKNLTKDVEMLKLRFEDNEEELYKLIANSILSKGENGVGISELVDEAITRCMVTLVHDGSITAKKLREKFDGYDWISVRNSFENDVLLSDICEIQNWFNENMFPLEVYIDDSWKKQVFEKDSYAALLFVDILSELLTNIFRYADKSKLIKFEFSHREDDIMTIVSRNHIGKDTALSEDGGFGLQAEADVFNILNKVNGAEIDPINISSENGEFEVTFQISNKLFVKS